MFSIYCYLVILIPIVFFFALSYYDKRMKLWELIALVVFNFSFAFTFNYFACKSALHDTETWSGKVVSTLHRPAWVERYDEAIYRTVTHGTGKERYTTREFSHYESRTRHHPEDFHTFDTFERCVAIDQKRFEEIAKLFGGYKPTEGVRRTGDHNSRMISGDSNDYVAFCGDKIYPVTILKDWENRVKACPSLFSYPLVNGGFEYPLNYDTFKSDRLLGEARKIIDILEWDKLNAVLGPKKKVNLIAVGFVDKDIKESFNQEAKWIGGKKNDLVITFSLSQGKISWVRVFGWSESDLVKRNIESLILKEGFILNKIEQIIIKDYEKKDWKKFNYLEVEISFSNYVWFLVIVLITNVGWIFFAKRNEQ